jgi:predicted RecB family endonuclease
MSRHEAPEVGAAVLRMMNGLIRRAAEGDTEAIEALAEIEAFAPRATNAALALAHHGKTMTDGYSYAELAAVTGTSRPAVQQRVTRAESIVDEGVCHLACLGMRKCREVRA